MSAAAILEAAGLTKRYGSLVALDALDLSVSAGESLAVFGPNGAGKTTLTRVLATALRPTSGTLRIAGRPVRGHDRSVGLAIGWVSHASFLYDDLSGLENLVFFGKLCGVAHPAARAEALLDELGLYARADDAVRTYSRGMQQRLSVARALVHDPAILLLDEPFTGLDPHAGLVLRNLLGRLRADGRTIVMATHDLAHGLALSDRFVVLARGKVATSGRSAAVDRTTFEAEYFRALGVEPAGGAVS